MTKDNENAVATTSGLPALKRDDYLLLRADPKKVEKAIQSTMGAKKVGAFDLERAAVPSGGAPTFVIHSGGSKKHVESITGILLAIRDWRTFYKKKFEGGSQPPDCSSNDALEGFGDRDIPEDGDSNGPFDCLTCKWAKFGSDGRGQKCGERRALFILRPDNIIPLLLVAPPSSLKAVDQLRMSLAGQLEPLYARELILTLNPATSADGIDYSKIAVEQVREIPEDQQPTVEAWAEKFQETADARASDFVDAE